MSISVNSALNDYTYGSGNTIRPKIDKNDDGSWSKAEVKNFAGAYEKATGNKIDIDKLFEKYDVNKTGQLDFKAQESVYKDDALNLKALAKSSTSSSSTTSSDTIQNSLDGLLSKMSVSSKVSLSNSIFRSEQNGNLLSMFSMDSSGINNFMSSLFNNSTGSGTNVNSYLGQMMNMMI